MLKSNRLLTIFAAIAFAVAANAASMNLGFCNGRIAAEGISKVGNARIEAAVILPEALLSQYTGAKVSGVRIGLVTSDGITDVQGWVRSALEEENLDAGTVTSPVAGWNTATLDGGLTIDGSPLAVGFAFSQEKGVKCISLVGNNRNDGRWICKNGKWEVSKSKGVVSVELIISGNDVPATDLAISAISGDVMPVAAGSDLQFTVDVFNPANNAIDGFDIRYSIDGGTATTSHSDSQLNYGESASASFSVNGADLSPDIAHTLTIEAVCENDDRSDNNIRTVKIGTYTTSLERRVLIEEFTTEECPNCPRAINTLQQCINAGYGERINIVAHHAGFGTDWLTRPEDKEYLWFYDPTGEEGGFAPAAMLDRTVLEDNAFPVNSVGHFDTFEPMLKDALAVPAFVDVSASASYTDNDIKISVDVTSLPIFEAVTENPRLSVFVIEDNIPHRNQAGITSDSFKHSHVFRHCVSEVFGTPFELVDNKAHFDLSVPAESRWAMENVSIVAFVHDHNTADIDNCRVFNAVSTAVSTTGIKTIKDKSVESVEYFTLSGIRLAKPTPGTICIRRTISESGKTYSEKVRL